MSDSNRYIAVFLRRARNLAGLTAKDASEKLLELGIKLSGVTISGYENNRSMPDAEKFLALCAVYGIENPIPLVNEVIDELRVGSMQESLEKHDIVEMGKQARDVFKYTKGVLGPHERDLVESYRKLSPNSKKLVDNVVQRLGQLEDRQNDPKTTHTITHPVYDLPVSAGTGSFLDGDSYELVDFPEGAVPLGTNFAVRVSGDSMEPEFKDGSVVFVKQTKDVAPGEVGIFILNNEGFIKIRGHGNRLESINKKYKDIVIGPYDDCRIVGKVVGKH